MTPQVLADRIEAAWKTPTSLLTGQLLGGPRPGWTKDIKELMGDLGKSLQFGVAASGYERKDQGEFLYDMVWYNLDGQGFVLNQPMVMEIEWVTAPMTVVDDDFQKLVQARADVRVWVSTCANLSDVDRHVANCEKQTGCFDRSQSDDLYVLVFFEWNTKSYVVRRLPAQPISSPIP